MVFQSAPIRAAKGLEFSIPMWYNCYTHAISFRCAQEQESKNQPETRHRIRRGTRGLFASLLPRSTLGLAETISRHRSGERAFVRGHFRSARGRGRRILPPCDPLESHQAGATTL